MRNRPLGRFFYALPNPSAPQTKRCDLNREIVAVPAGERIHPCFDGRAGLEPHPLLQGGGVGCGRHHIARLHGLEVFDGFPAGREAIKDFQPMQPGDVVATAADTTALEQWVGFKPCTSIETGVDAFARWYRDYFAV